MLAEGEPGSDGFTKAVRAFVDQPGICESLGFPSGTTSVDIDTGAQLLLGMKRTFEETLASQGARFTEQRKVRVGGVGRACGRTDDRQSANSFVHHTNLQPSLVPSPPSRLR